MAVFQSPVAVNNAYYSMYTSYSHNPTTEAINMGYQNAAIFGYVHAGYALMYSQYWVPLYYYLQYQPQPCYDHSWILNAQEEEDDDNDEIELSEEELREWDLLDREIVFYDAIDDDNGLSEETITKHLNIRDCHHHHHHHHHHHQHHHQHHHDQICVVCQECLFEEDEKVATLDCGHDFHAGCIKSWLMIKNSCPLCKATGIYTPVYS
ncbi:hypothetical protein CASFOL_040892 [Castilleja foliolosa]|uniref:RING-type E3 ubiquitin transferase n=1 Tax=Castilleja foliolosa TaxID=1961234 RepID=A0ABD3BCW4_9LAMI